MNDGGCAPGVEKRHIGSAARRSGWLLRGAWAGPKWPRPPSVTASSPRRAPCTTSSSTASEHLHAVADGVALYCSQVGALAAIGGPVVVLDHVSQVDASALLHGPLVQG